ILDTEVVILRVRKARAVRPDVGRAQAIRQRWIVIRQRTGEIGITAAQDEHRVGGKLQRRVGSVQADATVVAQRARKSEAIAYGRSVQQRVAAPDYQLLARGVCESEARVDLLSVAVLEGLLTQLIREDQRSRPTAGCGIGSERIEVGHAPCYFVQRSDDLPAQAEVECEFLGDLPIIHQIEARLADAMAEVGGHNAA